MKFYQLIDYCKRINFIQKSCTNWCKDTGSRPIFFFFFFFLKKALYEIKASCLRLIFSIFQWFSTWHAKQTLKNFILLIKRYAQFWLFRKGSGSNFSTTFCVWFFNLLTNQISLSDWLSCSRYWEICLLEMFLRLQSRQLWNYPCLSNEVTFLHD